uniref:Uncharacterized protein n=1 Tax=Cacopsylla melanoneura TaxID=428564 RepID=A0A8D8Y8V4_9HEMI
MINHCPLHPNFHNFQRRRLVTNKTTDFNNHKILHNLHLEHQISSLSSFQTFKTFSINQYRLLSHLQCQLFCVHNYKQKRHFKEKSQGNHPKRVKAMGFDPKALRFTHFE